MLAQQTSSQCTWICHSMDIDSSVAFGPNMLTQKGNLAIFAYILDQHHGIVGVTLRQNEARLVKTENTIVSSYWVNIADERICLKSKPSNCFELGCPQIECG